MKKLFFSIILMLLPLLASAQTFIGTLKSTYRPQIPKDLCLLNHKYFFDSEEANVIRIYDEKFELIKEFISPSFLPKYNYYYKKEKKNPESEEWIIEKEESAERSLYWCYQYDNYNGQSFYGCPFSQTLFSDDEKFEFYVPTDVEIKYTVSEYNGEKVTFSSIQCSGINVVSEDGVVLATFSADGFKFAGEIMFLRVDNILYALFSTNDENNPSAIYKVDRPWSRASNPIYAIKEGDVNKDGKVNVADHVKLSNIIMNEE